MGRTRTKVVEETIESTAVGDDVGGHPLFPAQDNESEPPEVGSISVCRWNSMRGQLEYIPRRFAAEEILDLSQVYELFGGGKYELIARNRAGNRIVAKRAYVIPGDERPLVPSTAPTPESLKLPTPAMPSQAPAPAAAPNPLNGLLPLLLPILLEYFKSSATERQAAQQQMQQMMMTMMQQQQASSQAFITAMSNLHATQAHVGTGSRADFMAGIEFAENMLAGKLEELQKGGGGVDSGEIFKTIGTAFEMLKLLPPGAAGGSASPAAAAQTAVGGPTA